MSKAVTTAELKQLAAEFKIPLARLQAFIKVESSGAGFDTLGRIKILFERHIFYKQSGDVPVSQSRPDLSNKQPGGYSIGKTATIRNGKEWERLKAAQTFHKTGALLSASFGAMQVMGFNFAKAGYKSVEAMVTAFELSEANQIRGGLNFCKNTKGLIEAIRAGDWQTAARLYNGVNYHINRYDEKLAFWAKHYGDLNSKNIA
jgi:hypothetical protein